MGKRRKTTRRNINGLRYEFTTTTSDSTKRDDFNPLKNIADELGDAIKGSKRAFKEGKFSIFTLFGDSINLEAHLLAFQAGRVRTASGARLRSSVEADVQFFQNAVVQLLEILNNQATHLALVRKAYDSTIRPVLEKRLGEANLKRGGPGRSSGIKNKRNQNELGAKWEKIYDLIRSPIKLQSSGNSSMSFYSFTIEELLAFKMASKSRYTSVFMMAEFGTGQLADTPGPRKYKGGASTPFKVSPQLGSILSKYGGSSSTAQWFSRPEFASAIERIHLNIQEKTKQKTSGKIYESDRRKVTFGTLRSLTEKERSAIPVQIDKNLTRIKLLIDAYIFGKIGPTAIAPRHVIFSRTGVVVELQRAYKQFLLEYVRLLNNTIREKVGEVWAIDGFKATFPDVSSPFNFDIIKQQMAK